MTPTIQQLQALRAACDLILEAVRESGPLGAPAGVMYAALMAHGCTLNQFESIMGALVRAGKLRKSGDCYHVVEVSA